MAKHFLAAALLSLGTVAAQAQPSAPGSGLQPSVDSAASRQAFQSLSMCLAKARQSWARETLSKPYLSKDQATVAAKALVGEDRCAGGGEAEFNFRTSGLVGSMAEMYVRPKIERADVKNLAMALNKAPPLNASEDFALCLAARDAAAARDLIVSGIGSAAEMEAARRLAANVKPCSAPGESLTVDLQALRSLIAVALYRSVGSTNLS